MIRVGLVGTGYAARLRVQALQADPRAQLVAIVSHSLSRTQAFVDDYGVQRFTSLEEALRAVELDLIVIATVNAEHATLARTALLAQKHVVVEYPLALTLEDANNLIALARSQRCLLHVEHIELLGSLQQAFVHNLEAVGNVGYVQYTTVKPQRPAPRRWNYQLSQFGFPLVGALSRLQRLIKVFGLVDSISCQAYMWSVDSTASEHHFSTCLCTAQLAFKCGVAAQVTYGKGERIWLAERRLEVHGDRGALHFDGNQGVLIHADATQTLEVGSRRGVFAADTRQVLDHLTTGQPLYIIPEESVYALKVALAAATASKTGQRVHLD
ncbi:MAG: Gfo/Idh/MocA family oxidoreductase [Cyanobacteria bacterium P01_H01_bin.121]